jgi:hypothetical protein
LPSILRPQNAHRPQCFSPVGDPLVNKKDLFSKDEAKDRKVLKVEFLPVFIPKIWLGSYDLRKTFYILGGHYIHTPV